VVLLVVSTVNLMGLFGNPSQLDEVVRASLVESLASRLKSVSRKYSAATQQLDGLVTSNWFPFDVRSSTFTLRVPPPRVGLVVKAVKPNAVRSALAMLAPRVPEGDSPESESVVSNAQPRITLETALGERTRIGRAAFRVITHEALDEATQDRVIRLLQSSIEFEAPETVTADEETNREIASLKDAVGTSIRSGAFATAERAVELTGHVVRGGWTIQLDDIDSSHRSVQRSRDWLFRSIGEIEQDAVLSPRAAGIFVGQAMARALEAPHVGSTEYVDECLRSFTRIWLDVLQQEGTDFDQLPTRIVVCMQSLAAYSVSGPNDELSSRAAWAMVELVKLALDAQKPKFALLAAEELDGLFRYPEREGARRVHVRAGQLVLSGWLDYLADKGDVRKPADASLRELVTPHGTFADVLAARNLIERGNVPFCRWDWWETATSGSVHAHFVELPHYIDRAEIAALASSYEPVAPANDQQTASDYQRFAQLLDDRGTDLSREESLLKEGFIEEISKWRTAENSRLAVEPLSDGRVDALRTELEATIDARHRLAAQIPRTDDVPGDVDASRPILGVELRCPRHYFVDETFNDNYADPAGLGQMIARGMTDGEERKIVELLRSLRGRSLDPSARAIGEQIDALGEDAQHYVLLTPYRGLADLAAWYSTEFSEVLARAIHFETSALDGEAILFDGRTTLMSSRRPEEKEGLAPVGDTSIALGVFDDVRGTDEPLVRIETGEYFVVWPGDLPHVIHFGVH